MFAKIKSIGLFGLNVFPVDVETDISKGVPSFDIVGLPDAVVRESRERIRSAMRAYDIEFPPHRVMVNLAPADTKKTGSVHDLGILVAILRATNIVTKDINDSCFIGEVSLNGDIRAVNGVLPMTLLAMDRGIKNIFVPYENAYEASVAQGINVYGIKNVGELLSYLCGEKPLQKQPVYKPQEQDYESPDDFSDVKGQKVAKLALEIASAGGHNALMIGSPGSGKSMLAKRIPSILPPMTFRESIETTKIYSIAGVLDRDTPLIVKRPFRSPHHTISSAGLAGGGTVPKPGEISLAHNGVLFLDELAEFDRRTLEILRQPLEDGRLTISRASGTFTYPASVMLIGAMNPCPCGYYGHPTRKCTCDKNRISKYLSKISGPLLDRFDLHIEVPPVEFTDLASGIKEESSAEIRKRIIMAREIQNKRFAGTEITCNAKITSARLLEFCNADGDAMDYLKKVFNTMGLSARAYSKILKVARTIADISGEKTIKRSHIAMAVQYRSLDRKYWGG
jgi:magnesium chelatase family protein